jgi:hypothetical protein
MTKITINDKEYDTENFTEEQNKILQEAQMAAAELGRLSYLGQVLEDRRVVLVQSLVDGLADG